MSGLELLGKQFQAFRVGEISNPFIKQNNKDLIAYIYFYLTEGEGYLAYLPALSAGARLPEGVSGKLDLIQLYEYALTQPALEASMSCISEGDALSGFLGSSSGVGNIFQYMRCALYLMAHPEKIQSVIDQFIAHSVFLKQVSVPMRMFAYQAFKAGYLSFDSIIRIRQQDHHDSFNWYPLCPHTSFLPSFFVKINEVHIVIDTDPLKSNKLIINEIVSLYEFVVSDDFALKLLSVCSAKMLHERYKALNIDLVNLKHVDLLINKLGLDEAKALTGVQLEDYLCLDVVGLKGFSVACLWFPDQLDVIFLKLASLKDALKPPEPVLNENSIVHFKAALGIIPSEYRRRLYEIIRSTRLLEYYQQLTPTIFAPIVHEWPELTELMRPDLMIYVRFDYQIPDMIQRPYDPEKWKRKGISLPWHDVSCAAQAGAGSGASIVDGTYNKGTEKLLGALNTKEKLLSAMAEAVIDLGCQFPVINSDPVRMLKAFAVCFKVDAKDNHRKLFLSAYLRDPSTHELLSDDIQSSADQLHAVLHEYINLLQTPGLSIEFAVALKKLLYDWSLRLAGLLPADASFQKVVDLSKTYYIFYADITPDESAFSPSNCIAEIFMGQHHSDILPKSTEALMAKLGLEKQQLEAVFTDDAPLPVIKRIAVEAQLKEINRQLKELSSECTAIVAYGE